MTLDVGVSWRRGGTFPRERLAPFRPLNPLRRAMRPHTWRSPRPALAWFQLDRGSRNDLDSRPRTLVMWLRSGVRAPRNRTLRLSAPHRRPARRVTPSRSFRAASGPAVEGQSWSAAVMKRSGDRTPTTVVAPHALIRGGPSGRGRCCRRVGCSRRGETPFHRKRSLGPLTPPSRVCRSAFGRSQS